MKKTFIIRYLTVIGCMMLNFYSYSQVIDTSFKTPLRNNSFPPFRIDTSFKTPLRNSLFPPLLIDTSHRYGLVQVDSIYQVYRIDSVRGLSRLRNNNIYHFLENAMTRGGGSDTVILPFTHGGRHDSLNNVANLNTKAESPYKPYEGRIIRHIIIKGYGFEQTFSDTSKRLQYFGTKLLNNLHHKTRDWVIRNSLFIKENTALNAYKLADNERLIRSLNYIQDARILVNFIPDNPDSVDLVVVVKDLFSIGGEIGSLNINPNDFRGNVSDANAFGLGQRIQLGIFAEQSRQPNYGYQLLYNKSNIGGTFTNMTATYSQINGDLLGTPDEQAWFVRFDRPLYAPYAHLAGNITVGNFESFNRYATPDSLFYKYHYRLVDNWVGWNLGSEKFLANTSVLDRRILAIRYFQNHFYKVPYQIGENFNYRFNEREAVLGQMTFFRQEYIKTNYIYGFGTTEDVPYGYNVALTGGWYRQVHLERPYAGVDATSYVASKKGDFLQYFLRSGAFFHQGNIQDASILVGTSIYSRLFQFKRLKIRQYFNFSYTRQFNRVAIDPLTINNVFGLRYFSGDSTFGTQRITLHSETTFFLSYKLFGFKFAPFTFGDLSLLTPETGAFSKSALYHGLGAGIRGRNENLIFQTIELRLVYFPRPTAQNNSFKLQFNTGIQFRYNNNYVRAPDIIYLNTDGLNSIY